MSTWLLAICLLLGCKRATEQTQGIDERLVWNLDSLLTQTVDYKTAELNSDLRLGPTETVGGLAAQRLGFALPPRHLRVWSEDGRILYAFYLQTQPVPGGSPDETQIMRHGVARIDTQSWRVTHLLQLPFDFDSVKGVALTSQGLVVAYRDVELAENNAVRTIDRRTGKTFERVSIRHLIIVDPHTFQLKKVLIGPSAVLAGSPHSPVVCVSDDGVSAKLVDVRSGKVLDVAGRDAQNQQLISIEAFEEFLMSPDGKTLYHHSSGGNQINRTDISKGKFAPLDPLKPDGAPIDNSSIADLVMHLSPDGKLLAILVGDSSEAAYSIIPTNPDSDVATRWPLTANRSTDFSFVGKENRIACNGGERGGDYRAYDLVLSAHQQLQLYPDVKLDASGPDQEYATLCGSSISEHVLVSDRRNTLWVQLPPNSETEAASALTIKPLAIRGFDPDVPLEFAKATPEDRFDEVLFRSVPAGESATIVCSYEGTRLYLLDADAILRVFDTDSLREIRRAKVERRDDGAFRLWMTKFGPLVKEAADPWFQLFDGTTLDGLHQFRLPENLGNDPVIHVSPNADCLAIATDLRDLEVFDLRSGKLIQRVSRRQFARHELPDAVAPSYGQRGVREIALSDDGTILMCLYYSWHVFQLSNEGLRPIAMLPQLPASQPQADPVPIPLPEIGLCYLNDQGFVKAFDFPGFAAPGRFVELPAKVLAISRTGLIYTDPVGNDLQVYDANGRKIFGGRACDEQWEAKPVPVPNHPERVFVLENMRLHVADLDRTSE